MEQKLFAPTNFLETCLGLQEIIAAAPPDEKRTAGNDAREMILQGDLHYYGARKLEIRTLGAFALPDKLTQESEIWPVIQYGGLRMKGLLANISFFSVHRMNTLAWMIADPLIRANEGPHNASGLTADIDRDETPDRIPLMLDHPLRRPLYLPVGMIESVLIAA